MGATRLYGVRERSTVAQDRAPFSQTGAAGDKGEIEIVGRLCQTPTVKNGVSQKRPTIFVSFQSGKKGQAETRPGLLGEMAHNK